MNVILNRHSTEKCSINWLLLSLYYYILSQTRSVSTNPDTSVWFPFIPHQSIRLSYSSNTSCYLSIAKENWYIIEYMFILKSRLLWLKSAFSSSNSDYKTLRIEKFWTLEQISIDQNPQCSQRPGISQQSAVAYAIRVVIIVRTQKPPKWGNSNYQNSFARGTSLLNVIHSKIN